MVTLALPKGSSLEQKTLDMFAAAGLDLRSASSRSYRGTINYRGTVQVAFYKPREIPLVVQSGHFDLGLTGADWIEEAGATVECVASFNFAKAHHSSWRLVLAVPVDDPAQCAADISDGVRVATEYPNIARAFFRERGQRVDVVPSYGATEAKIPELADAVVDVVETGSALRHNGLRIVETLRVCTPQLIAGRDAVAHAGKRATIRGIARLLSAVEAGATRTLITVRVATADLHEIVPLMPARSWRVGNGLDDDDVVVLQGLVERRSLAESIDELLAAGALDVVESGVPRMVAVEGPRFRVTPQAVPLAARS